ncbi:LysR family transcriptional regulator [Streptomyces youssoufiensis]
MDLVGACRAFVSVSERGSFTVGAAAARMSQSAASRRVAALEERFGEPLFERASRRARLTPFGRDMLPVARQLVQAADVLLDEAEAARRKPWRLAVPDICSTARLARLVADARGQGVTLDLRVAAPAQRGELLHAQQVRAALLAVPAADATWSVPLGLAGVADPGVRRVYLDTLRVGRASTGPARRVWVQPEDDVPHVRDPLARLRDAVGLRPAQLATAADLTTAAAEVLATRDLLLCSPDQADELALHWRPIGELALRRGFALAAAGDGNPHLVQTRLGRAIARCLGAAEADAGDTGAAGDAGGTSAAGANAAGAGATADADEMGTDAAVGANVAADADADPAAGAVVRRSGDARGVAGA